MEKKKHSRLLFIITVILLNMAASFAHPVTPTIFKNLNLGDYMFGVALGSMTIVNFLLSPFWGKINTYISSKKSLFIGCLGYALGQAFFGLAKTETQFIIARSFTGAFTGAVFVSLLTYVVNTAPDERQRGRDLTLVATIQSVGSAFGFLTGGLLGEIHTYLAIVVQVICLVICGISFFLICEDDASIPLSSLKFSELAKQANPFQAFVDSRKFLNVVLAFLFGVVMTQSLGFTAFDQSFNYYIKDVFGFSSGYNGLLKGAMGIITLIANTTIALWLINKTDLRKSIVWILAICVITVTGVVLVDAVIPFIIINVLFFAFNAVTIPMIQALVSQSAKEKDSNLVMGFYNAMKSLGSIIGAFASGALYTMNPKFPFVLTLVAFFFGTIFAFTYQKRDIAANNS
ncbi:MAG: MFS transporter [Firmicutes bacterium]|nr:MFS transporter [Bacillota bacterium]